MLDLTTTYLGLTLKNPLVAAASPLSKKITNARRLEDAGVSAVVMYSLFEEQIVNESRALNYYLNRGTESYAEALSYFPEMDHYNIGPEEYLGLIQKLKSTLDIPVIASLNGVSTGGWINYAHRMQEAGADALELNIYYIPTDFDITSAELEQNYIDLVSEMRQQIRIPMAVKLSPYFTALPSFARHLVEAGASGLVLFNRFYQPDLDIESLEVVPSLELSTAHEMRLPLRWIAILYGRLPADLALTTGAHNAESILKAMMAGASVVQPASALLLHGIHWTKETLASIEAWMERYEYESIQKMRGSMSQQAVADPAAFERANYMKALTSFDHRILA
ncbi:MAG: dihydroorotate dehydrogenase-like protein [Anaerolineaceae bacterium]|nr:dihydroorotate dehydrogenase-like protein [Anaerolineaceae bacterium]